MTRPYGGPSNYNQSTYQYQKPPPIKIVSEKEAKESLAKLLNGRLNPINDHISANKIRTELSIDLEKSFVPNKPLSWIVTQIECLDPDHHFEYDPRDDDVKFIKNGCTYESMAARTELVPSMPLPSSSDISKKIVPVDSICDSINEMLKRAYQSGKKVSISRIESMVMVLCNMTYTELMDFIKTHIATGDICGILVNDKMLDYNGEEKTKEKRVEESMSTSMKNLNVDNNEKRRYEGWRDDREEKRDREDREDRWREEEKSKDYGQKSDERYDSDNWREEEERKNNIYYAKKMKKEMKETFPYIRHLPYLIYLLQKVDYDSNGKALYVEIFQKRLDGIVGGDFNYELFGLTVFSELIYHRLIVVVERKQTNVLVQINPYINIDTCRVDLLRGYMAGFVYNYVLRNGRTSFRELYEAINHKNSRFLHEEFPKWEEWGEKDRMLDVKASYKSYHDIFIMKDDKLELNEAFCGLVASPFVLLFDI